MPIDQPICRLRFPLLGVRDLINQAKRLAMDRVLWFSGDDGAYLTCDPGSAGAPSCVYAEGYNPSVDPDFRRRLDEIFGQEEFEEAIPLKDIEESFKVFPDAVTFIMEIYPQEIEFVLSSPKGLTGQVRHGIRRQR